MRHFMRLFLRLFQAAIAILLLAFTAPAIGDWESRPDASTLTITTTKNGTVQEQHSFDWVRGYVRSNGKAVVQIRLASINTNLPIRDERIRELLLGGKMPTAQFAARVDIRRWQQIPEDTETPLTISGTFTMNNIERAEQFPVTVVRTSDTFSIQGAGVIDVADYSYSDGVAALQAIANLASISTSVPFQISLVMTKAEAF